LHSGTSIRDVGSKTEENVDPTIRTQKLDKLLEIEGFKDVTELAEAVITEAVSPAICCNPGCSYTCEMEPDQDRGYCEECHTNSMKSALVLAGLI
jgi:hypothetical protein